MDDFDDDDVTAVQENQKHAAKISENDKDALLASGDEREDEEEYTDIFSGNELTKQKFGSAIFASVDFEEGESVSASDDEITGYTGDLENYTESELDLKPELESVAEGTLINIHDDVDHAEKDGESVLEKSQESTGSVTKSVTNESISEIAEKLAETEVGGERSAADQKPGKPIKIIENDSEMTGYLSSGEATQFSKEKVAGGGAGITDQRRKIYRKRTMSHGNDQADEGFTSSGEYQNKDGYVNGSIQETRHKPKKKNHKPKQHGAAEEKEKLVDIETPPQTPSHQVNNIEKTEENVEEEEKPRPKKTIRTIPIPGFKPAVKTATTTPATATTPGGSQKKRKRTRHKVYLDDPDVHQLIIDHSLLLQKYLEDVKMGRAQQRPLQAVEPPSSYTANSSQQQQQQQNEFTQQSSHVIPPNAHHQRHHHHQPPSQPQQTFYAGHPTPTQGSGGSASGGGGGPYSGGHQSARPRGKNVIARIRNEELSSSSTDEEEDYGKPAKQGGYHRVNTGSNHIHKPHSKTPDMEICPDCGEYHAEVEVKEEEDICPDCGVRHNPYQHRPGSSDIQSPSDKPWKRYKEACHEMMAQQTQKYQEVSTEQDPEDVRQETLPSIDGPHEEQELNSGVRYKMKYLGSCQITTQHPVTKETRMQQAQDAYKRIKSQDDDEDDDDDDVSTNVDMLISLERIKIINKDTKFEDVMMDHALRTVCFICDMGNVLVLMARRLTSDHTTDFSIEEGKPITLGSIVGEREKKTSKNICHVFESEVEASKIAKAIGQAFNMAYRQFLTTNGIAHEHVEEAEYGHVLESQKLVGQDLDRLTDTTSARDVVVTKRRGDALGVMLLESGWGSMLPTVFIAHLANYSAAARSQRLSVGDHILTCNSASLVGLPLSECNTILRNTKSSERVVFRVVSCPPVVDVVVSRPDVKYQLGFSVQNGTICSLLRGGIAERGGVRVGHRIIEINGDSVVAKAHQHIVDILANTVGSISMKTMPVAMYRLMVGDDQPEHV